MKPPIKIAALFEVCNEIRRSAGNAGSAGSAVSAGTYGSAENAVCADSGRECRERLETQGKWTE
jgi:hypothetical protein